MTIKRFDKAVALVTGGASGLGKAIAQRLASDGVSVVISDIQADVGNSVADENGFVFLEQNVSDEVSWTRVVTDVERRFGRLTILVNSAGILGPMENSTPEHTTLESWRKIFAANVEGVFLGCRAAIPAMRKAGSGSIINLASIAERLATPHVTAYGASKAAVRQLTQSVAQYCAQERLQVRCNSVDPGMIRTPMLNRSMEEVARERSVPLSQIVAEHRAEVPLGDFTQAEDIAAAVAFLASEDARHITGSVLIVDGGIVNCNTYRVSQR